MRKLIKVKNTRLVRAAYCHSSSGRRALTSGAALFSLALCLLAMAPSGARAEVHTIDFDDGTLDYPLDREGGIEFRTNNGFRPYFTQVGTARASSGEDVGDLGRCTKEVEASGGDPGGCESFQARTTAVLSSTARSVSVSVGRFGGADPPEQAVLVAFDLFGHELGRDGPVPLGTSFRTPLEVDTGGGIAFFRIEARTGPNGEYANGTDLGIDDLSVNFAAGGEPDFAVSTTSQVVPLVQGQSAQVPVQIDRVNGSSGPIELSVTGLPKEVSAVPVELRGTEQSTTITVSAGPDASDTQFQPIDATIVGEPLSATAGPGPRSAPLSLRVGTDFGLALGDGARDVVEIPDCAAAEVPVRISRDIAFHQDVSLSLREDSPGASGLPPGLSAEILPSPIVSPGGGLVASRTLVLRTDPGFQLAKEGLPVVLVGSGGSGTTRRLPLALVRALPRATVVRRAPDFGLAKTPRFGQRGTAVRLHGSGFCPGTRVEVGNRDSVVYPVLVDDHTLEFNTPRYATTGPVTIEPPGSEPYTTEGSLKVDDVRNTDGFQFINLSFRSLSLSEFVEAFGADDVFISINPCWPFGDCRVHTLMVDPIALIEWQVFSHVFKGHCFGMALGSQELVSGRVPYGGLVSAGAPRPHTVFDVMSPEVNGGVESWLDADHAKQLSSEAAEAWVRRPKSIRAQLDTLEREFEHRRKALVAIRGGGDGHELLAYDLVQTPTTAEIHTYDPNKPFIPYEDATPYLHRVEVDTSVIRIDKTQRTWEYTLHNGAFGTSVVWKGGEDGSLWVRPESSLPADPSLPEAGALKTLILGSTDAVRTSASGDSEFVPADESPSNRRGRAIPTSSGTWVSADLARPLHVSFVGVKHGHYTEGYAAPGFVAAVDGIETDKGVRDAVDGNDEAMTFASGRARALQVELAQKTSKTIATAADLHTHASAHGSDTAGFTEAGALTYAHQGAPTTLRFALSAVRSRGGPATFVSGPLAVGRGERLTAKPLDRDLRRVRLIVRDADGHTTIRILRSRGHGGARLKLGAPTTSRRRISIPIGLRGLGQRPLAGVVLRLMRGGHLVARRARALRNAREAGRIAWRLPRRVRPGRYRLVADVRAMSTGQRNLAVDGVTAVHRAWAVRVGRP
jgi:hypothetical protein